MNLPSLKTVKQWIPFVGSGLFLAWIALLTVLNLFRPKDAEVGAINAAAPGSPARGCVTMPDGIKVCDDVPPRENTP